MITIKASHINSHDFNDILAKMKKTNFGTMKEMLAVRNIIQELKSNMTLLREEFKVIAEKYAKLDEHGKIVYNPAGLPTIDSEKTKEFEQDLAAFLDKEITFFKSKKISERIAERFTLSVDEYEAILPFIE